MLRVSRASFVSRKIAVLPLSYAKLMASRPNNKREFAVVRERDERYQVGRWLLRSIT